MASRSISSFYNGATKPVSIAEFHEAVVSTCRPNFPPSRASRPRRLALAVSGGVDSMALAFLSVQLLKVHPLMTIADNPINKIYGIVVDHNLREGSEEEAAKVDKALGKLGIRCIRRTMTWKTYVKRGLIAEEMTNAESVARVMRHRIVASTCSHVSATSVFYAHHEDDQYETLLMRLLSGHGYRGLQGIREANNVPECNHIYGLNKSGFWDDQFSAKPFLMFRPSNKIMRIIRSTYRRERKHLTLEDVKLLLTRGDPLKQLPANIVQAANSRMPYLTPLFTEDGGITAYRPLLGFSKDRLRATCEANDVPWFEDHTNQDPKLTMRNAVRHLVNHHDLPQALQKPAILGLLGRVRDRAKLEDAEAHRRLAREAAIKDFDPNAGTLLVELPNLDMSRGSPRRLHAQARKDAGKPHLRTIASIMAQKIIDFVTPELHQPPLSNLGNAVDRLFPELSADPKAWSPRKAFAIAGVLFDPVPSSSGRQWFLSRAPYTSSKPHPRREIRGLRLSAFDDQARLVKTDNGPKWRMLDIWDGRFWLRLAKRVDEYFAILPLYAEHLKPFRESLPPDTRRRLEELLKYHAPGKVRYSLPALYIINRHEQPAAGDKELKLLALPSLGIQIPGLEKWAKCLVTYKKVDKSLLGLRKKGQEEKLGYKPLCSKSRQIRAARLLRKRGLLKPDDWSPVDREMFI